MSIGNHKKPGNAWSIYGSALLAVALCIPFIAQEVPPSATAKAPVLVELFTSEGCSSCPPADRLLIDLKKKQPFQGAEIIALGFHVDYWDHEGWKDRFSSAQFTARQKRYAERFRSEIYTPQLVVDGINRITESNNLPTIISKASAEGKALSITLNQSADSVDVGLQGQSPTTANVFLALVEDDLETAVIGGENQGRKLQHAAVVRDWHALGRVAKSPWSKTVRLGVPHGANRSHLQVVGFAQDTVSGKILGLKSIVFK